jgi:hypothetical protein
MGAWRLLVALAGILALLAAVIAAYYVVSFGVLYLVARILPLGGRRRRR